jgi:hypothetical protein
MEWQRLNGRGLGKIRDVFEGKARNQPTSLGFFLRRHVVPGSVEPTPLIEDYIRASSKQGTAPEVHGFFHLTRASREGHRISQCQWEQVDHDNWVVAGGWEVDDEIVESDDGSSPEEA